MREPRCSTRGASEDLDVAPRAARPTWCRRPRHDGNAVAFLFAHPLRAGEPENPANKILWVVKEPRGVSDLVITAHPLDAAAPTVHQSEAADSSPGEIYPSIVNVPAAGMLGASPSNGTATRTSIDLPYTEGS